MRKAIALFLLSLLLPLRAAEWRDDACSVNLPDSPGWFPIRLADVPGTTVLIAIQHPVRQVAFGVNVINNPPSTNLSDSDTIKAIEQQMRGLTYQFLGHSTVQIGTTKWLQYPVTSTFGGLNAKGIIRFTSANGRIFAISMLAGGGREPGADSEMQQAAASFRVLQTAPLAVAKPAPVVAVAGNNKTPDKQTEPATTTPAETDTPPAEETDAFDIKRIAIFATGAIFVIVTFFQIIGKGSKPKPGAVVKQEPKPEPKSEPKPKAK